MGNNPLFDRLRRETTGAAAGEGSHEYLPLRDGTKIFLRSWAPNDKAGMTDKVSMTDKAGKVVVCFHGAGGQGEFFSMIADILTPAGTAVYVADYRGHGLSEGFRGDYGTFEILLQDCAEIVENVRARHPRLPLFILGESMGGAMAVNFAARFNNMISGLILFAPALRFLKTSLWPDILLIPCYLAAALFTPGRPVINITGKENTGIKNPLHVEYDKTDPLHLKRISPRYFLQLNKYMTTGLNECPAKITVPCLIFQGGRDAAIDPEGARGFMERLVSKDKELIFYPEGFHVLLTDPDAPDVATRLADWVLKH